MAPTTLSSPSPLHPPGFISAMFNAAVEPAGSVTPSTPVLRTVLWSPTTAAASTFLPVATPPTSSPPATPEMDSDAATPSPGGGSLFVKLAPALLPTPQSPPSPRPAAPANRRKTLAVGYTCRRSSLRIKNANRGTPIAKMAELNLCRRLGIVDEAEDVSEEAVQKFISLFNSELSSNAVAALRALFRLDYVHADAVEAALLSHGG
jgi:hypothetical protein